MEINSSYSRNQPRQYRILDTRPTHVPPALIDYEDGKQIVRLPPDCTPILRTNEQYGNPHFISWLAKDHPLRLEHGMTRWEYRHRSSAQAILPFLLLGPINVARDPESLQNAGVTMLVAVRSKTSVERSPNLMNPTRFPSAKGRVTATFDIDTPFDAIRGRSTIIKAMNDHIEASCVSERVACLEDIPAKILVFCETGNERSPVLVAMYLMVMWGLDAITAYQAVQARRFGIGMLPTMPEMLESLNDILKAEREVMKTQAESLALVPLNSKNVMKRNIEESNSSEDTMNSSSPSTTGYHMRLGMEPFSDVVN